MLFKFLVFIVFIAELIITFAIIINLIKFDMIINRANLYLTKKHDGIISIAGLANKISAQLVELTDEWVENLKKERDKIILKQLESIMAGILFWSINIKAIKRIRKSKLAKAVWKGLSLAKNVI